MKPRLTDYLRSSKKVLVGDGAWGTMLYNLGLPSDICPEVWCLEHPEVVEKIAAAYIAAGANVIETNSFGGNPWKLAKFDLESRLEEINEVAAAISSRVAGDSVWVMGSVGPSGKLLMMDEISEQECYEGYARQIGALARGGVDAICIETMSDLTETLCAIRAARDHADCEIVVTFTFNKTRNGQFRTIMGVSPQQMVESCIEAGVDVVGSNCGQGIEDMVMIAKEMHQVDPSIPLIIQANAGLPVMKDGKSVFPDTPEDMGMWVPELIHFGVRIIGGCCGTSPDHIRAIAKVVQEWNAQQKN